MRRRLDLEPTVFVTGVALADSAAIDVCCTTTRPKAYPMGKPVFKLESFTSIGELLKGLNATSTSARNGFMGQGLKAPGCQRFG
eukprot:COSAG02_NODE_263_length_26627_cov_47.198168_13_plen_84_part_00